MSRARELADQHKTLDVDGGTIKLDGDYPVGTANVALGNQALDDGSLSGSDDVAIGAFALSVNTSGTGNVAVGSLAMITNSTGNYNTAVGSGQNGFVQGALGLNTTGTSNVAVGYQSLRSNTTASNNTALGYQAGYSNQTGAENTYIGHAAGYTGTGSNNCFVGQGAGYYATGTQNTYIGKDAGVSMTSGSKNVIIGKYTGNNGGLDIRTSSNNIVLSDGDGNPRFIKNGDGTTINTLYNNGAGNIRESKGTIRVSSAFDNPTVNLITTTLPVSLYPNLIVKVVVQQTPWSDTIMPNQHEGTATWGNNGSTKQVSAMTVTNSTSSSTSAVGTLSWSGNTLRYTSNRASNYDSYYISFEVTTTNVAYTFS